MKTLIKNALDYLKKIIAGDFKLKQIDSLHHHLSAKDLLGKPPQVNLIA